MGSVSQFIYHEVLYVAETIDHPLLHLCCLELVDNFVDMTILSLEILLLEGVELGLLGLHSLLFHRRRPFLFCAVLSGPLATDFSFVEAAFAPDLQIVQLFVQHH